MLAIYRLTGIIAGCPTQNEKKKKKKRRLVRFLLSFLLSSLLLFVECDRESSKFGESFLEGTSPGVFSKQKI